MDELSGHPPVWVSHGAAGSRFWDLDGNEYVDMYVDPDTVAADGAARREAGRSSVAVGRSRREAQVLA